MKLKFFIALAIIGIGVFYVSCNKEEDMAGIPEANTELIDFNKIKMPRFSTVKEFRNTLETVTKLKGQDYLEWEKQYGFKTIYGDYVRARMEIDTITTWESYLSFRDKWKGKVSFPSIEKREVNCFPKYFRDISIADLHLLSKDLVVKINKYYYYYEKDYTILIKEGKLVTKQLLSQINEGKKNIQGDEFYMFKRKVESNESIELRDGGTCYDNDDPPGSLCSERRIVCLLENTYLHEYVQNGFYYFTITENAFEWSDRQSLIGWVSNDANLRFDGHVDGLYDLCYEIYYEDHVEAGVFAEDIEFDLVFDASIYGDELWQTATDVLLTYPVNHEFGNSLKVCHLNYGNDIDQVDYYAHEYMGWPCSYNVDLHCTVVY